MITLDVFESCHRSCGNTNTPLNDNIGCIWMFLSQKNLRSMSSWMITLDVFEFRLSVDVHNLGQRWMITLDVFEFFASINS